MPSAPQRQPDILIRYKSSASTTSSRFSKPTEHSERRPKPMKMIIIVLALLVGLPLLVLAAWAIITKTRRSWQIENAGLASTNAFRGAFLLVLISVFNHAKSSYMEKLGARNIWTESCDVASVYQEMSVDLLIAHTCQFKGPPWKKVVYGERHHSVIVFHPYYWLDGFHAPRTHKTISPSSKYCLQLYLSTAIRSCNPFLITWSLF